MNYQVAVDWLYRQVPMFQQVGGKAFNKSLDKTLALAAHFGQPQKQFKSIHIAGTNGKGSVAHMLAAILQVSGYKTALYTSPHLKSFTERMKINGEEIAQDFVLDFIIKSQPIIEELKPSFFELTTLMAFDYFAKSAVDVAVIETGMGGRLDSTNIIDPEIAIITTVARDHAQYLGETISEIAGEKVGIIKANTAIITGNLNPEASAVAQSKAKALKAPHYVAVDYHQATKNDLHSALNIKSKRFGELEITPELKGDYQQYNIPVVLEAVYQLREKEFIIPDEAIHQGIAQTVTLTKLKGRWQQIQAQPHIIADIGHNEQAFTENVKQLLSYNQPLHFLLGFSSDKDLQTIFPLLPKEARYTFTKANMERAMSIEAIRIVANQFDLKADYIEPFNQAYQHAKQQCSANAILYIGGSAFIVAEIPSL